MEIVLILCRFSSFQTLYMDFRWSNKNTDLNRHGTSILFDKTLKIGLLTDISLFFVPLCPYPCRNGLWSNFLAIRDFVVGRELLSKKIQLLIQISGFIGSPKIHIQVLKRWKSTWNLHNFHFLFILYLSIDRKKSIICCKKSTIFC